MNSYQDIVNFEETSCPVLFKSSPAEKNKSFLKNLVQYYYLYLPLVKLAKEL